MPSSLSVNGTGLSDLAGCSICIMMLKCFNEPLPVSTVSLYLWLLQHLMWSLIVLGSFPWKMFQLFCMPNSWATFSLTIISYNYIVLLFSHPSAKLKSLSSLFSYRCCSYFQSSLLVPFFRFCYILCEMSRSALHTKFHRIIAWFGLERTLSTPPATIRDIFH